MDASDDHLPPSLLRLGTYSLSLTGRAARTRLAERLATRQLTLADMALLSALADFGPAAQGALARRLRIDPGDTARLLDGLDTRGAVARERDPVDRRRLLVTLTREGRALLTAARRDAAAVQRGLFKPLSADEQATLLDLLARVHAHVDPRAAPA